jgi:AcrR family transcriptional regulator
MLASLVGRQERVTVLNKPPDPLVAEKAGVGIGTIYRHFPQRSDLIVGVFRREVDACADAEHQPGEALARWIRRYVDFLSAKRGLAAALHSGDPAYNALPAYFQERLLPAFQGLLEAAAAAGKVRGDVEPYDVLRAVASLCMPGHDAGSDHARRMVDLLIDGLRHGATTP